MLGSISLSDLSRNAILQSAYEFIFVLVVVYRSAGHKAYQRSVAQSDSYRQRLINFFSLSKLDSDIMERQCLDTDTVDIFDLDTVDTYILFVQIIGFSRIAGNDAGFRKEETAILIVDPIQRQDIEQIDIFGNGIFLTSCFFTRKDYRRHREFIPAAVQFMKLFLDWSILRHTHHQSVVSPGTMHISYYGILVAFYLFKQNSRFFIHISASTSCCTNIRLRINLVFNTNQLTLVFQRF